MPELDIYSGPAWMKPDKGQPPLSLAEAFQLKQQQKQQDALLPLKQQEMQAQIANAALDHQIKQEQVDAMLKSKSADAALWQQIAQVNDASDLTQWKAPLETVAKNPWVSKTAVEFMQTMIKGGQTGKDKLDQLNAKIDADSLKSQRQPNAVNIVEQADAWDSQAKSADEKGDTATAEGLRKKADLIRATLKQPQESRNLFDAQGNLIFSETKGGGMPQGITPGLQTKAQEDMLNNKKNFDVLSGLSGIDAGSVGVKGVLGNVIFDRLLSQVDPSLASDKRIDDRTKLISIQKKLAQSIVYSPRATKEDKAEANAALPSPGMAESVPDIQQKARSLGNILKRWTYDDAKAQGVPPPYWSMSNPDEIKTMFNKKKSELEKAVVEGKMTSGKAKAEILRERADVTEVLESQYNYNVLPAP